MRPKDENHGALGLCAQRRAPPKHDTATAASGEKAPATEAGAWPLLFILLLLLLSPLLYDLLQWLSGRGGG